jgi:chorismate-pyruvate lyase
MRCGLLASLALLAGRATLAGGADGSTLPWPDTPFSRLQALALLQTLNSELLSHDSATLTLEHWCGSHHLADPVQVIAQRVTGVDKPAGEEQRRLLQVDATEPVRYRRVQLTCGGVVLSQADNWYVPARLSHEMNAELDSSDTPFGKVVGPLHFQRHTLSATLLWQPLPEGWDSAQSARGAAGPSAQTPARAAAADQKGRLTVPTAVLEHRAVLTRPDGTPFSEVVETYTGNVLAFPMPLGDRK